MKMRRIRPLKSDEFCLFLEDYGRDLYCGGVPNSVIMGAMRKANEDFCSSQVLEHTLVEIHKVISRGNASRPEDGFLGKWTI